MSLKMTKGSLFVSAALALTSLAAVGCGGDSGGGDDNGDKTDSGGTGSDKDAGAEGDACYLKAKDSVLVNVLANDPSGFIATPHPVEILSAETGMPFNPPIKTMTGNGTGKFNFGGKVPCYENAWIHVTGVGPASDKNSTYDSLGLDVPPTGEILTRISTVGTSASAETTGGFTSKADRVGIGGAVYRVDASGKRIGSIGCVTIELDGKPSPDMDSDQRYVASSGLPATLDKQKETLKSGKFYFGNVSKGPHSFKVKTRDGRYLTHFNGTDELKINVPLARQDASGDFKNVLVLIGLDIKGDDPTPADCQ